MAVCFSGRAMTGLLRYRHSLVEVAKISLIFIAVVDEHSRFFGENVYVVGLLCRRYLIVIPRRLQVATPESKVGSLRVNHSGRRRRSRATNEVFQCPLLHLVKLPDDYADDTH